MQLTSEPRRSAFLRAFRMPAFVASSGSLIPRRAIYGFVKTNSQKMTAVKGRYPREYDDEDRCALLTILR